MPGTILGTEDPEVNKTHIYCLCRTYILEDGDRQYIIKEKICKRVIMTMGKTTSKKKGVKESLGYGSLQGPSKKASLRKWSKV